MTRIIIAHRWVDHRQNQLSCACGESNSCSIALPGGAQGDTSLDGCRGDARQGQIGLVRRPVGRHVDLVGKMSTVAGTGVRGRTGDDGPAEKAQTSNPDIIALDHEDNLFIPDHINSVVRKLTRVTAWPS